MRVMMLVGMAVLTAACATLPYYDVPPFVPGQSYDVVYNCTQQLGCVEEHVTVAAVRGKWLVLADGYVVNAEQIVFFKVCDGEREAEPPVAVPRSAV